MLQSIVATLTASLLLISCGKAEPKPSVVSEPSVAEPPARPAPIDGGLQEHMQGHFESIRAIERAIVFGEVETANREAAKLASHQDAQEIANYSEELNAVRETAETLANEKRLEALAVGAATLASQCGSCHLITNSITSFEWIEAPSGGETNTQQQMQRHRWAMDRLWEGLVGPSEHSWNAGASALAADPTPAEMLSLQGISAEDASAKLALLQSLATKAQGLETPSDRANVYGELLTTCSGCHSLRIKTP